LISKAAEANTAEPCLAGSLLERGTFFAVADDHQVGMRIHARCGREVDVGFQQVDRAFAAPQLGGKENNGPRGIKRKLGAKLLAADLRLAAPLLEELVIYRIGHRKERKFVAQIVAPIGGVEASNGEHTVDHLSENSEEELFGGQLRSAAFPVAEPGF